MRWAWASALLLWVGCRGEQVEATTGDAAVQDVDAAVDDAAPEAEASSADAAADAGADTSTADTSIADTSTADSSTADTSTADTSTADTSSDADTGGCTDAPDNLVSNASFEAWSGASAVSWLGPITRTTIGPYHCASAARFVSEGYGDVRQEVVFPAPLAGGTELEMTMAARWVSGVSRAPAFNLYFYDSAGAPVGALVAVPMTGFKADGNWYEGGGRATVPGLAAKAFLHLVSERPEPQTFEIDKITVRVAPKDGGS
ncbi:MAG: hypothetical protein HYV09_30120 [Deltaproteobacteria bacterium]|nr:hypothetical protein [Deltaproteobacteria bacterium]